MSIKDFLAFALVILLAVAIFAPSASDTPAAATVYPASSSVYMAAEMRVLEGEDFVPHVSSTENTLNSDIKVLVQVGLLAAIGLFAGSVVRRWQYR